MADQGWRLPAPARRALRELATEHRETVHLYVRRDVHRICIAQEEGPRALRRWTAETLRNGYAVSHGEHEEGLSSVAVPVRARDGEVVAALSFGGPSARFTAERLPRFVNSLTMAARAVGGSGGFGGLRG